MVPFRTSLLRRIKARLVVGWAVSMVTQIAPFFLLDTVVMNGADAAFFTTGSLQKYRVSSRRGKISRIAIDGRHTRFGVTSLQITDDVDDRMPPILSDISSSSTTTTLISKSMKENSLPKQKKNANGIYVRPSAAIERGSGFFVPGLEGYKVRLLVGGVVVLLTVLLHYYHASASKITNEVSNLNGAGNSFAESLAIFYGLLVLLQGCIEARKDFLTISRIDNDQTLIPSSSNGKRVQVYQQQWSIEISDKEWRKKVEWVASTYLSLTSATEMILVGPGKIIFSLGVNARPSKANDDSVDDSELRGCNGALATLAQSNSGRLSLPMNHISVQTLLFPSSKVATDIANQENVSSTPRSVILQRINDQLCWMMVSDQLLASFATSDLQWLGQLAQYTDSE